MTSIYRYNKLELRIPISHREIGTSSVLTKLPSASHPPHQLHYSIVPLFLTAPFYEYSSVLFYNHNVSSAL